MILRDALFRGFTRFTDFQRSLAIAPNILTKRLNGFVAAGLLERGKGDDPEDQATRYIPTAMGMDLKPVIMALTYWGDRWRAPDGPPVEFRHEGCGGRVKLMTRCSKCEDSPYAAAIAAVPIGRHTSKRKV